MTSHGKPSRRLCSCIMVTTDGNKILKNAQNLEDILFYKNIRSIATTCSSWVFNPATQTLAKRHTRFVQCVGPPRTYVVRGT